jgi:hypothetical protein
MSLLALLINIIPLRLSERLKTGLRSMMKINTVDGFPKNPCRHNKKRFMIYDL